MRAGRTFTARCKSVPARQTAAVKIFGRVAVGTPPAARGSRFPAAVRTADARKLVVFSGFLDAFENFFGFSRFLKRLQRFFEKQNFQPNCRNRTLFLHNRKQNRTQPRRNANRPNNQILQSSIIGAVCALSTARRFIFRRKRPCRRKAF